MCRNRFKQFSNFLTLLDIYLIYGGRLLKLLYDEYAWQTCIDDGTMTTEHNLGWKWLFKTRQMLWVSRKARMNDKHCKGNYCTSIHSFLHISGSTVVTFSCITRVRQISPIAGWRCPEGSREVKVPRLRDNGPGLW